MRKKLFLYIAMAVFAFTSCSKMQKESKADYVMSVNVSFPKIDSVLLHKTYPASLSAKTEVKLVARVNGFLQAANYKAGEHVEKGKLLFVIEPEPYKEALLQAEAQLASAKSQNEYAKINYESMKEAAATNAVSQIDFVQAESNWNQSVAAVKSAKAALENAKINLGYCYIKAPFSGRITSKSVDIGNFLNGSSSPQVLATIYDDETMTATFTIEDSQYMRMVSEQEKSNDVSKYQSVTLSFNESLPHSYAGKLSYLSPMVDLSTGTITLQAKVDNPYGELKSGMYCVVSLPYKELPNAMLIKDSAISTDQLGKYIYTVNDSGKVVYTPVKIGDLVDDTLRVVIEGLLPNQRYVTQAIQKVRDGMIINPVMEK